MTSTRADPKKQRFPSFVGQIIVDTYRGQLRVRKWPRKRGRPKSAAVRAGNEWFKKVVKLMKIAAPSQQAVAIDAAKGTGLYPRDLLMNAMSGGMFDIVLPDGRVLTAGHPFLEEVMFLGAVLEQDTPQALPTLTYTSLTFPTPVIDTTGFWDILAPTRLTIPAGVEVVNLFAGWKDNDAVANYVNVPAIRKNGVFIARAPHDTVGFGGGGIVSGPRPVVLGDWFDFQVRPNKNVSTAGDQESFFAVQVLQTATP